MSARNANGTSTIIRSKVRLRIIPLAFVFVGLFYGCGIYSAIPITLKEVKDYVVANKQSFSYPLNRVLSATLLNLKQTGFTIVRIEHFNHKGLVKADWQETSVILSLESVTPKLTKIKSTVRGGDSMREYSTEEELFNNVRKILNAGQVINWKNLVSGMVGVHLTPHENSRTIAYMGVGVNVEVFKEDGNWGKIKLMDGGSGFVDLLHLRPVYKRNI